jgi:hypothetical protein
MKILSLMAFAAVLFFNIAASAAGRDLSAGDKQFLAAYGKIQTALAADDLDSATTAAKELGVAGADLGKSKSLEEARSAFANLSVTAEKLATGEPGYYVFHCGMANKDWVQTSAEVANPYTGKAMAGCGEAKN